jgi:hypothetical protein
MTGRIVALQQRTGYLKAVDGRTYRFTKPDAGADFARLTIDARVTFHKSRRPEISDGNRR